MGKKKTYRIVAPSCPVDECDGTIDQTLYIKRPLTGEMGRGIAFVPADFTNLLTKQRGGKVKACNTCGMAYVVTDPDPDPKPQEPSSSPPEEQEDLKEETA